MRSLVRFSADGSNPVVLGDTEGMQCNPGYPDGCALGAVYGSLSGVVVVGDRIYTSRPDRNEISIRDIDGNLVEKIYGAAPLQPVTEAMRKEFIDAAVANDPSREAEIREQVTGSFYETVPAFLTFLVSKDGYIWTQEYQVEKFPLPTQVVLPPRTAPIRWTVYDPEGSQLGDVPVPVDFAISEIGEDYVLGVARDELGVERIRAYSIVRP
jgi:hypothetical protein